MRKKRPHEHLSVPAGQSRGSADGVLRGSGGQDMASCCA